MSYNGSGTFQINTSGQPVVTGTAISSTVFNALTADLATGLSTAITKDGQTTTTARIPFALGINSSLVTDASSTTTGSIITAGGVGIAKALYVGTTANIAGDTTLSGGTANGVAYLNGSKVLTTGSALVFDGTNLGVGVTPSGWSAGYVGFQVKNASLASYTSGAFTWVGSNWYNNSGNKYIGTGFATLYEQTDGKHAWLTAASGTAGNAITFTQAMTLDASGNLGIGTTSPRSVSGYTSLGLNNTTGVLIDNFVGGTRTSGIATTASSMTVGTITSIPLTFLTADTERARIDTSGNLLVGSTTASAVASSKIYVKTSNQYGIISEQAATGQWCYSSNALTNGGTFYHFNFLENGTQRGSITSNGTATTYGTSSDYRLKENIAPMTGALSTVAQLNPVTYKWKSNGSDGQGFIAHELQAIVPDAVVGEKDAVNEDGSIKPQGIDTSFLVATLTAAIQEQQALITTLTARITALESA